jgi:hypothetical protein
VVALPAIRRTVSSETVAVSGSLVGLTLLGAVLRFATLGDQSYWHDEAVTVDLVHRSLWGMLSTVPHSESTPPLYYVLAWVWARLFSTSEVGLRSLSALFGTALIPVAFLAAQAFLRNRLAALVAAAFTAVSPLMVWYSQEARTYELFALLGAASLLFFARSLDDPSRGNLWSWAGLSAATIVSHYFGAFLVISEAAVLLWKFRRQAVLPSLAALVVGIPLVPLAKFQYHAANASSWIHDWTLKARLLNVGQRFIFFNYNPGRTPALVLALAFVVLFAYRGRSVGRASTSLAVGAGTLVLPVAIALAGLDLFYYRNVIVAWLPIAIVVCAGVTRSRAGLALGSAFAAGMLACTLVGPHRIFLVRDDWRDGAKAVAAIHGVRVVMPADPTTVRLYSPGLRPLPSAGLRVSEVDVLGQGLTTPASFRWRLPAFKPVSSRQVGNLVLIRMRAASPQLVRPSDLPWQPEYGLVAG